MKNKKTILVLDRGYSIKYMKSDIFDIVVVCLQKKDRIKHEKEGLRVIGCFGEEYDSLDVAEYPSNYLDHSLDSDRFLKRFPLQKRREILGKEIAFWRTILERYKPDCIVNEVVTIEFMEVMYIEAKKRGIPYYTWGFVPFAPKDIWVSEPPYNTRMVDGFWESVEPTEDDYDSAKEYIAETRNKGHKPFYICNINTPGALSRVFTACKGLIKAGIVRIKGRLEKEFIYEDYYEITKLSLDYALSSLCHNYDKLEDNENEDLFFYPLHLEPEAAVEYSGFYYNDQVMLIGRIAHSLTINQKLIVKEHPQQEGVLLTKRFRELKKKYPNLIYLPGRVSSYTIYPKIKCLITLNGTAGFESWVCHRPVIVFGEVFYKDFPGITRCNSFEQLFNVMRNEMFSNAADEDIVRYVAKICHLLTDTFPYIINGSYNESDCNSLAKQFEQFIQ